MSDCSSEVIAGILFFAGIFFGWKKLWKNRAFHYAPSPDRSSDSFTGFAEEGLHRTITKAYAQ
jgi:hypothetical protein